MTISFSNDTIACSRITCKTRRKKIQKMGTARTQFLGERASEMMKKLPQFKSQFLHESILKSVQGFNAVNANKIANPN